MVPVAQSAFTRHCAGYLLLSDRIYTVVEGVTLADDRGLLLMQGNYRKFLTLSRFRLFSSKQYSSAHVASVEAYGSEAHAHVLVD